MSVVSKPSTTPRWANVGGGAGIVTPASGKLDTGWSVGDKPPAQYVNWFWNLLYQWILYVQALTTQANTWADTQTINASTTDGKGVVATGNGAGAGVLGTGGSSNGSGVVGQGAGTLGPGVVGTGASSGAGGLFNGGSTAGNGLSSTANGGNGNGAVATGHGTGAGVTAAGGATSGPGVSATGGGTGAGGTFTGGTPGSGVGGDGIDAIAGPGGYGAFLRSTAESGGATGPTLVLGTLAAAPTVGVVEGSFYYDSVAHALKVYTGSAWKTVTAT